MKFYGFAPAFDKVMNFRRKPKDGEILMNDELMTTSYHSPLTTRTYSHKIIFNLSSEIFENSS